MNFALILETNYGNKQWSMSGEAYDGITWLDESPKPTEEEMANLWQQTQVIVQNKQADRSRKNAYQIESDPLFFKTQRGEATIEEWQAKIEEIKQRYPKIA
jgi:ABC-type Fe3+-hydroxamate transport system substrate-binding protein